MSKQIGFIILRHVNNELTNKYWVSCVNSIRKYYPENDILIIDDNSNYKYITEETLYKTTIINSEYPKRGELLPYYYYLHNKQFDVAVIIHDSVVINRYIDMNVDNYKIIWSFEHTWDQIEDETKMINVFNDLELKEFYENKKIWKGCFGGMCIIRHDVNESSVNMEGQLRIWLKQKPQKEIFHAFKHYMDTRFKPIRFNKLNNEKNLQYVH